jgi:heme-degrading monooxygenase HmoA
MNRVRAMTWYRAAAGEQERLHGAFCEVSRALEGTPGLVATELLRSGTQPDSFVVMSEWESLAAFRRWQSAAGHSLTTALRPFLDRGRPGQHWDLLEVSAAC